MAKEKTTKAAAPAAPGAAPVAAAKADRGGDDIFVAVLDPDGKPVAPTSKLAPQAQCIVNTIAAAGESGITRANLVKNLTGVLVTRQPVGRIVTYYQKAIQEAGAVKLTQVAAPTPTA